MRASVDKAPGECETLTSALRLFPRAISHEDYGGGGGGDGCGTAYGIITILRALSPCAKRKDVDTVRSVGLQCFAVETQKRSHSQPGTVKSTPEF